MKNDVGSSTPSSKNSGKQLKIDFFESANGETIIVEFPDGGLGIVDAHPSREQNRPPILELLGKKKVHFVCLTHPHADHGVDLIPILQKHRPIDAFWHTNPDVSSFVYHCATERPNYPSPVRAFVNQLADGWADFLLDLYSSVEELPERKLHSKVQPIEIAGARVWILGPDEQVAKQFVKMYKQRASGTAKALPSPNLLSAILGIEYGGCLMVLGSDALKAGWNDAIKVHKGAGLPRALVLKVPHHGAANALALERNRKNYLDLCRKEPRAVAILFAGDSKHPNKRVFEELRDKTQLLCLSNGQKGAHGPANPLNIKIPGARQVRPSYLCQAQITVELSSDGNLTVARGASCELCQAA
jgi:beta-lactamase superfamily II metal-dependent hydrolase